MRQMFSLLGILLFTVSEQLMAVQADNHAIAVIYEQVKAGAKKEEQAKMSLPSRDIAFDRVMRIQVPVQMKKINGDYGVTVTLPFTELGLGNAAGKTLRGDFGIQLTDSTYQRDENGSFIGVVTGIYKMLISDV